MVFRSLFCSKSSLSKTDLIFLKNIVSAGETASGVLFVRVTDVFLELALTCLQNV